MVIISRLFISLEPPGCVPFYPRRCFWPIQIGCPRLFLHPHPAPVNTCWWATIASTPWWHNLHWHDKMLISNPYPRWATEATTADNLLSLAEEGLAAVSRYTLPSLLLLLCSGKLIGPCRCHQTQYPVIRFGIFLLLPLISSHVMSQG